MKSLYIIEGYGAVIPHIQNIYPPEKTRVGWQFGFKYISGVFEFFTYKTLSEARSHYNELVKTIEEYYNPTPKSNGG